jgi:hypothetical protein
VVVAACVIAAAVAAAATRAASPLTVAQYRAKQNAICAGLATYQAPAGTKVQQLEDVYAAFRTAIASSLALPEPVAFGGLRKQLGDVLEQEVAFFGGQIALLKAGKITPTELSAHLSTSSFSKTEAAIWAKIGAKVCVKD